MQNQSPNDSDPSDPFDPIAAFEALALKPLPTWCFSRSNWIGGSVDVLIIVLNVVFSVMRYRSISGFVRQHHNLLAIQKILSTPVFVEEGNSMILTFIRPSDRLLDEMKKMSEKATGKKTSKK